jgi:hypothetical protein
MGSRLWHFLNSNVGLWLLGPVLLGLVAFLWRIADGEIQRENQIREEIDHTVTELEFLRLKAENDLDQGKRIDTAKTWFEGTPREFVFPELQQLTGISLIHRLIILCPESKNELENAKRDIVNAKNNTSTLKKGLNSLHDVMQPLSSRGASCVEDARRARFEKLVLEIDSRVDQGPGAVSSGREVQEVLSILNAETGKGAFSDFATRSVVSLLQELRLVVDNKETKVKLTSLIDQLKRGSRDPTQLNAVLADLRTIVQASLL